MKPMIASLIGLPPTIGLLGTLVFIFFLFWKDIREKPSVTSAVWLPVIWIVLMGSRSVGQWLKLTGFNTLGSLEEGSPLDAAVYLSLIVLGFSVLNKRQLSLSEVVQNNAWIAAFLLYCFLAIFWSDYPFV